MVLSPYDREIREINGRIIDLSSPKAPDVKAIDVRWKGDSNSSDWLSL